jgi:hypothetical protein
LRAGACEPTLSRHDVARRRRKRSTRQLLTTIALVLASATVTTTAIVRALEPGPWQRVYATREGEIGKTTATGLVIAPSSMFVALPHRTALGKDVEVRYGTHVVVVPVLDVGPWNTDDAYWRTGARPAAERGQGRFRTPANEAGIDLSDPVFRALALPDNSWVDWRFVHRGYQILPWL